jgi:hypothetical protein
MNLPSNVRGRSERCWVDVGREEWMLKRGVVADDEVKCSVVN